MAAPTPRPDTVPAALLADLLLDWLADGLADRLLARLAPLLATTLAPTAPEPLALPLVEVARRLGVSRSTAYELCRSGQLPSIRIGTKIHVSPTALARYVARHEGLYGVLPVEPARPNQRPTRRRPRSA